MAVIDFSRSGLAKSQLDKCAKRLVPEVKKLRQATYQSQDASLCVPNDRAILRVVESAIHMKRKLNPQLVVVVGIGGSNLGTQAIAEAVGTKLAIRYADTVDSDALAKIADEVQDVLRQGSQVIINIISKSGSTLETVANFEVLLNVLRRHRKNAGDYVVATTDKGSALWNLALNSNWSLLEIPKHVGGRYSVFTPVGLFPLGLAGVDIVSLLDGAQGMLDQTLSLDAAKNPAARGAAFLFLHNKARRQVHDTFIFAKSLESLGKWYRQLLAESVGKEFDKNKKRVRTGILPTVSVGSTDLHSVGQLYLGGPDIRTTNFVTTHFKTEVRVPSYPEFNKLIQGVQKRTLSELLKAIASGTMKSYAKKNRPYIHTRLDGCTARELGAFMQLKMVETMLLAKLLNVNAFDQPNVESYKVEARRILSR